MAPFLEPTNRRVDPVRLPLILGPIQYDDVNVIGQFWLKYVATLGAACSEMLGQELLEISRSPIVSTA
jgi:hypothetical protein